MMNDRVLSREQLASWLETLSARFQVIAPVSEEGLTRFQPVSDPAQMALDGPGPSSMSLREHFTPPTEVLFRYTLSGAAVEIWPPSEEDRARIVFGARACDAAALRYLDAVYANVQPADALYFSRRKRTRMVGLFCAEPSWSCFCAEVGDCLTQPVGMDIQLTGLGDRYYARVLTAEGEKLLGYGSSDPASKADEEAVGKAWSDAMALLPSPADLAGVNRRYEWEHPVWEKLARKCLGCGVCAFQCPTCHCFDIVDSPEGREGSRFRIWDTCQFEQFTLMGAGHNPRPSQKERARQRVFHKFQYSPERYGLSGCVGCGRCVAACPVHIDIRQVVREIAKGNSDV
ncbi:MAG: 4Fe-4S dicluster domain-containing protein [Armatimonadetes bacterium]|nr:4Fe-4S dicluster domain-containing protein [Armatimonadota bacterium]